MINEIQKRRINHILKIYKVEDEELKKKVFDAVKKYSIADSEVALIARRIIEGREITSFKRDVIESKQKSKLSNSNFIHFMSTEKSETNEKSKKTSKKKRGRTKKLLPLCKCGCGERVSKKTRKYVEGHYRRKKNS